MRRLAVLAVAATSLLLPVAMSAPVGAAVAAAPNAVDITYVQKNAQSDLAEITIGKIAQGKAQSAGAKMLADKTIADHEAALSKLKPIAADLKATVPTEPNPSQQADAAKLQAVSADQFDLTYATVQVLGHQLSIADTNTELSAGSDAALQGFASGYLPVAQMHLTMAEDLLTSLGGTVPSAVPAGSGGEGGSTSAAMRMVEVAVGLLGMVLLALGGSMVVRRRRIS